MRKVRVLTVSDAVALIPEGAVVSVSSSCGLGCPDGVLAGISERFTKTRSPRGLTTLPPQQVRVPGVLVDALIIQEDQWQTAPTVYEPAISGLIRRPLDVMELALWRLEKVFAPRAVNTWTTGAGQTPFGGFKTAGTGGKRASRPCITTGK